MFTRRRCLWTLAALACASCAGGGAPDRRGPPGAPRVLSPTSYGPRGADAGGSGAFHAPRGGRAHQGFDILVRPGDAVRAPIDGTFMKYGVCYADEPRYRYVSIGAPGSVEVKVFYVERSPSLWPGAPLRTGDVIGVAQAISVRYGGRLPDHLHVEVWVRGVPVDPEPLLVWRT